MGYVIDLLVKIVGIHTSPNQQIQGLDLVDQRIRIWILLKIWCPGNVVKIIRILGCTAPEDKTKKPQPDQDQIFFIEDLFISRIQGPRSSPLCPEGTNVPDILFDTANELIHRSDPKFLGLDGPNLIDNVKFIFCQRDACVVGKKY